MNDSTRMADGVVATLTRGADDAGLVGELVVELTDENGELLFREVTHNLISQTGDQCYGERGAGIAGAPAVPTGMKLGTGSTPVAKTGAGAALVTYLANSQQAFDAGFPTSALNVAARQLTYKVTFAAGKATTASPITEVVIVNDAIADATSAAANTISRALLTGIPAKAASDTLTVVWTHSLQGS